MQTDNDCKDYQEFEERQSLMDLQYRLEEKNIEAGVQRYREQMARLEKMADLSQAKPEKAFIGSRIKALTESLDAWKEKNRTGSGRKHKAYPYLSEIQSDILALISLNTLFDCNTKKSNSSWSGDGEGRTDICKKISRKVVDQYHHQLHKERNPAHFEKVLRREIKQGTPKHKITTILNKARAKIDLKFPVVSEANLIQIGQVLIYQIQSATRCIEISSPYINKGKSFRQTTRVKLTPRTIEYLASGHAMIEESNPVESPMICPPLDRCGIKGGGHLHEIYHDRCWIKVGYGQTDYLKRLNSTVMSEVQEAVNNLQRTEWVINKAVLDVMLPVSAMDSSIAGIPKVEEIPLPKKPDGFIDFKNTGLPPEAWNDYRDNKTAWSGCPEGSREKWNRSARKIYLKRDANISKLKRFRSVLTQARDFDKYDQIWFAWEVDYRGRFYPMANALSPQGCDRSRGLLKFATGHKIENEEMSEALAIHGANLFGDDKGNLDERKLWASKHEAEILSIAGDPLGEHRDFWADADKPWQFLAWCFEWAGFIRDGYNFISHIPITIDGSCNGLQVLYSIAKDKTEGARVNLLPIPEGLEDKPNDIYAEVAERAVAILRSDTFLWLTEKLGKEPRKAKQGAESASYTDWHKRKANIPKHLDLLEKWREWGVLDRKMAKKTVMTVPYSAKQQSCYENILEQVQDFMDDPSSGCPFNEENGEDAARLLSSILWEAVKGELGAAMALQTWFVQSVRVFCKFSKCVSWTAPTGFIVCQHIPDQKFKVVTTAIGHKSSTTLSYKVNIRGRQDEAGHLSAISPNITHSFDAAVMAKTINRLARQGCTNFAASHDEVGTHASFYKSMGTTIREVWVDVFNQDIPQQLHEEFKSQISTFEKGKGTNRVDELPEPPPSGDLDIAAVKDSRYFFV